MESSLIKKYTYVFDLLKRRTPVAIQRVCTIRPIHSVDREERLVLKRSDELQRRDGDDLTRTDTFLKNQIVRAEMQTDITRRELINLDGIRSGAGSQTQSNH